MKKHHTPYLLIVAAALFLSSCISNKKVVYLQSERPSGTYTNEAFVQQYEIRPNDLLQVRVNSIYPEANELLNQVMQLQQGNMNMGAAGNGFFYLMGFTVSDSGYVKLPMIGRQQAAGLTTDELEKQLEDAFREFYDGITVIVKVNGIQFSMLGEFNQPGQFLVYDNNISILEAIAMAGDMTDYANREEIQLIRTKGQVMHRYTLDMTKASMLEDTLFYLQRDDVIYAPPLKGEQFGFKRDGFVYTLAVLSLVSNLLLIYNLVNSL